MEKFSPQGIDDADIAIIGMAGRFPGAANVEQFWANLRDGVESIRSLSEEECRAGGVDEALLRDPAYVRAAAFLPEPESFDAAFFDIPPREAEITDPQHRVFLECAWEALEQSGYAVRDYPGFIGVFGGATLNTYLLLNLSRNPQVLRNLEPVQLNIGNGGDFLATRVAYKLNLKGAAHTVQSACSTSLVAVHVACQSILNEECDIALAGGVSVNVSQRHGYRYAEGGMASPDGRCRPFDAKAQGTLFGSGAGVVVLKRLRTALEDGDTVHAVIKGSAINNDGAIKAGYTAPGVEGQAQVVAEALAASGLTAEDISYVEAHGTATPLGDPIEVQALTRAFRATTKRSRYCALGSVKSNIGHLDAAAGITGLIKVVLSLKHQQLPPSLHFEQPNPAIDFDGSPFYVNAALKPWPVTGTTKRRAGVSSFGVGGTNAHVILEEAPRTQPGSKGRAAQVLPLSARSRSALDTATANLATWLRDNPGADLADVAWTLQAGRERFEHRRFLVCRDSTEAARLLAEPAQLPAEHQELTDRPVAFLFPGQGTQHVHMGRDLYESEPVFRAEVDRCATLLTRHLGMDLRTVLYPAADEAESCTQKLAQTALTQPALFVIEYALAQLWMSWGVKPQAMIGHSIGEYVAACLAGVFSLEDALRLVAARGRLMQALPSGDMLAVPLPEDEVQPYLHAELSLAALNGPMQCVLSGTHAAVEKVQRQLSLAGVRCQGLVTSHAFHSAMMDPILAEFTTLAASVRMRPPQVPFVSNVTGRWVTPEQVVRPEYWAQHLRQAVRFSDGLRALMEEPRRVLLEVGPGQVLSRLARRHPDATPSRVVLPSMPAPQDAPPRSPLAYDTLGRLWQAGAALSWEELHAGERRRRVALPGHPFERQRYWVEPTAPDALSAPAAQARSEDAPAQVDLTEWFHLPSWKRAPLPPSAQTELPAGRTWLVFLDAHGLGAGLTERLAGSGQHVVRVQPGAAFSQAGESAYALRPGVPEDYTALLRALKEQGRLPHGLVHLWSVSAPHPTGGRAAFTHAQETGLSSLLALARALTEVDADSPRQLWVVSDRVHDVTGDEVLAPEKAPLLGACRVLPQEVPALRCRTVDVVLPASGQPVAPLVERLLAEVRSEAAEPVVALRGPHRWAQVFEPLPLPASTGGVSPVREGGVYLVTHGTSGIGFELARSLARQARVKLALLEPSAFPSREEWPRWLSSHPETEATSRRIRNAEALEALGAEVLALGVELTDVERVRAAVQQAEARFGPLQGVLHAAAPEPAQRIGLLTAMGPEQLGWHLEPKALGLLALDHVLAERALGFRVLASSIASVLGGVGGVGIAASSAFLDAFAQRREGARWLSVTWDAWRLEDSLHPGARGAELDKLALSPEQGGEALQRLLRAGLSGQVVVCTSGLGARLKRGLTPATREAAPAGKAGTALHPRPELRNPYVAPSNDMERRLATLWQEALGVGPIGVEDNFFDLGGDSLLVVQISNRLKQELGIAMPATNLYEGLTVQALAKLLSPEKAAAEAAVEDAEREERQQRRKQTLERQRSRRRSEEDDE